MIESTADFYARVILNLQILLHNPSHSGAISVLKVLSLFLLLVVACRFLLHLRTVRGLRLRLAAYAYAENEREVRVLERALGLVANQKRPHFFKFFDRRPGLFSVGLWNPSIFLAPGLARELSDCELQAALVHELIHLKRRDALRIWIGRCIWAALPLGIVAVFATNFIYVDSYSQLAIAGSFAAVLGWVWIQKHLGTVRERSCDDETVALTNDPLSLASALVQAWKACREMPTMRWHISWLETQPLVQRPNDFERRIERLANYRVPYFGPVLRTGTRWMAAVCVAAALVFAVWFHSTDKSFMAERMWTQSCVSMALLKAEGS